MANIDDDPELSAIAGASGLCSRLGAAEKSESHERQDWQEAAHALSLPIEFTDPRTRHSKHAILPAHQRVQSVLG
jgi:hypothetical protein